MLRTEAPVPRLSARDLTTAHTKKKKNMQVGMLPLILTAPDRDYNRVYQNPYYGLLVEGGRSQHTGFTGNFDP